MIKLLQGDCLELTKDIPDGSVDLILSDPPYGTVKNAPKNWTVGNEASHGWDEAVNPEDLFGVANRILRRNGKLVLFSQEPYTTRLITEAAPNLPFSYRAIWEKDTFANALGVNRNMVSFYEDVLVFSKTHDYIDAKSNPLRILLEQYTNEYGKEEVIKLFEEEGRYSSKQSARVHASYKMGFSTGMRFDLMDERMYGYLNRFIRFNESYDEMCFLYFRKNPLRKYFAKVLKFIGKKYKEINKDLGHRRAEHSFYVNTMQFKLCTEETYNELVDVYRIGEMEGFISYEELRKANDEVMKESFPSVFNLWEGGKYKSNILRYKKDYGGYHPTQKPILLLEDLIKTFSNEGDLVVDLTMGSGSTAVACLNTNRNFIGMELDKGYFDIADERIDKHKQELK